MSHNEYIALYYIDLPNSACVCLQYTTATQVSPTKRLGSAVLSKAVPNIQNIHVTSTQVPCVPIDATGCWYQSGCKKNAVYRPAVTVVQQAENLVAKI